MRLSKNEKEVYKHKSAIVEYISIRYFYGKECFEYMSTYLSNQKN